MKIEDSVTISGRGLLVVGHPDGAPENGLVKITTPDGAMVADEVVGIERGGPPGASGILLKHAVAVERGSWIESLP
jgi:hypothetical protein